MSSRPVPGGAHPSRVGYPPGAVSIGPAARMSGPLKRRHLGGVREREDPLHGPGEIAHGGDAAGEHRGGIGELDVDVAVGHRRHQEAVDDRPRGRLASIPVAAPA